MVLDYLSGSLWSINLKIYVVFDIEPGTILDM